MNIENALKKLEKHGFSTTKDDRGWRTSLCARKNEVTIIFYIRRGKVYDIIVFESIFNRRYLQKNFTNALYFADRLVVNQRDITHPKSI